MRLVPRRISVVVIRDDVVTREAVAGILAHDGEFLVCASGSDIDPGTMHEARPDVCIVDAHLLEREHTHLVPALVECAPGAKIVATGITPDRARVLALVRSGVSGFVVNDASAAELTATIRSVASGVQVMPPSLIATLFRQPQHDVLWDDDAPCALDRMTPREREISLLIAAGRSNKDIAARTRITTNTVKCHVRNIMDKLVVHTRLEIAALANAEGWARRAPHSEPSGTRPTTPHLLSTSDHTAF